MSKDTQTVEQDMSVHDKSHPALGPTEEAQDVSNLNRIIVPVGAYADPNNPSAMSASVNLPLDKSPVEHAGDYGQSAVEDVDADSMERMPGATLTLDKGGVASDAAPANRDDWTKAHWSSRAKELGLPVSGNFDTVKERVEDHESESAERLAAAKELNAGDWIEQVEGVNDKEELDELQSLYTESGADFSTAVDAFDKRQSELAES